MVKTNELSNQTKNIITLDLTALDQIAEEAGKFMTTQQSEAFLQRWLEIKEAYKQAEEQIKEKLKTVMEFRNTKKIEGETLYVLKRPAGGISKYELVDKTLALDLGFAREETVIKIDSSAIDKYVKDTGELPEGVKLAERNESIVISERK